MRITRLYTTEQLTSGQSTLLSPEASHHVSTVLRMKSGDNIILFNGDGFNYSAVITESHKKKTEVLIKDTTAANNESPLNIHLAQAICRGEKMDFVIQKATELGITEITPIICERTQGARDSKKLDKKHEHWHKVMISACEQSGRAIVPTLTPSMPLTEFLAQGHTGIQLILHPDSDAKPLKTTLSNAQTHFTLAIGPEGGFSDSELENAKKHAFLPTLLGPRVLRTETAALAMIGVLQGVCGDF